MNKLVKNIVSYLEYLTGNCSLSVSVHFSESSLNLLPPGILSSLLKFNSHTNPYCISVKGSNHGKCILHQKNIIDNCRGECQCLDCHGGVREYINPILINEKAIGYIAVSGYRASIVPHECIDTTFWETALCKDEIPINLCSAVIPPLEVMLEQLFISCSKNTENEYNMIVQFLNEYHTNVTLADLCSRFGRSKSYISHMFRRENGLTVRGYCNDLKLEDAKKLLAYTDIPITDISFDVGFNDVSYFIYLFKRKYGVSPLKYRKIYTNNI